MNRSITKPGFLGSVWRKGIADDCRLFWVTPTGPFQSTAHFLHSQFIISIDPVQVEWWFPMVSPSPSAFSILVRHSLGFLGIPWVPQAELQELERQGGQVHFDWSLATLQLRLAICHRRSKDFDAAQQVPGRNGSCDWWSSWRVSGYLIIVYSL